MEAQWIVARTHIHRGQKMWLTTEKLVSYRNRKLVCILERKKSERERKREREREKLGNRIAATLGRKMIMSEIEPKWTVNERISKGRTGTSYKERQIALGVLPWPIRLISLGLLVWILSWSTGRGLGISPHFRTC